MSRSFDGDPASQGRLRILYVTARYLPFVGGVEVHTFEVARRLAGAGHDVTVLTTDPTGQLMTREEAAGVRIQRVRAWPSGRDYYLAPGIVPFISKGRWDILHCQGYQSLTPPLAMFMALRLNVPLFVTFHSGGHSSAIRTWFQGLQWSLSRPLLARAKKLIAVSQFEEELFRRQLDLGAEHFTVIPNGSDLPFDPAQRSETLQKPLIVSVGRLERYKGHQRVVAAMPSVLQKRPDARLLIVGAGPYQRALQRQIDRLNLGSVAEITAISGYDRLGMARLIATASVVVLMSDYESQGLSVSEALAAGRPVVVADSSALSAFAQHELATAIPLESTPDALADALLPRLESSTGYRPLQLPTWADCVEQLLALYRSSLGHGRRRA